MTPVSFRSLPLIVRLATMTTFFLAWVLFAEIVIDRHGLDRFLPFYRVGNLCPYDIAVVAALLLAWWRLNR
jgi:hypothetical protein